MSGAASIDLPSWARVSARRRAHIERVVALITQWSLALELNAAESAAWRDAACWHDALRDATDAELREMVSDLDLPVRMLHGPATATRLSLDGERRNDVLEAIRWHTIGCAAWARTGRALYMADYLEPGRRFAATGRESLAAKVPQDFAGVFREVVKQRLEWSVREGNALYPESVELWKSVR